MPDILTLAKGLGGGLPLGAMVSVGKKVPHFAPGQHGSTFGGNPVTTAAGLAVIDVLEKKNLLKAALKSEKILRKGLMKVQGVTDVRGKGLLLGIVLQEGNASSVVDACIKNGLLVNSPASNVIRIAPALNISAAHIQEFLRKFNQSMKQVSHD